MIARLTAVRSTVVNLMLYRPGIGHVPQTHTLCRRFLQSNVNGAVLESCCAISPDCPPSTSCGWPGQGA